MKNIYVILIMSLFSFALNAQTADTIIPTSSNDKQQPAAFSQFSLGAGVGGGSSTPKITLNSYRFSALIGKGYWDFYLFNSVPTLATVEADSERYVRNDLVKQLGGLLNLSVSKVGYFAYGGDPTVKEIKGAQVDFRLGGKAIDVANRRKGTSFLIPILQTTLDFRYLIPLIDNKDRRKKGETTTNLREKMIGNLSFRFLGSYMQVLNGEVYEKYYTSRRGVPASKSIFTGTIEMFFYITDQIYINAGYSFTNQELIEPIPFFSVSYGRKS
jgi:hypothetical protein